MQPRPRGGRYQKGLREFRGIGLHLSQELNGVLPGRIYTTHRSEEVNYKRLMGELKER